MPMVGGVRRVLLGVALLSSAASATVFVPKWFSDNMVLQDGPTTFLAGTAVPAGEKVTVTGDVGQYEVASDATSGHWKIKLQPASEWTSRSNMTVVVQGETGPARTARNVLPGDVFFCTGQSNMLFSLHQSINYTAEAATLTSYPNLRFFMTARATANEPQWDLTALADGAECDAAALPTPAPVHPWSQDGVHIHHDDSSQDGIYFYESGSSGKLFVPKDQFEANTNSGRRGALAWDVCGGGHFDNGHDIWPAGKGSAIGSFQVTGNWTVQISANCALSFNYQSITFDGKYSANDGTIAFEKGAYVEATSTAPPGPAPLPAAKPCNKWLTAADAAADNNLYLLSFSAVCFMTVRDIAAMHTGDRPMALIQSSWGGSRIESWMSSAALESAGPPVSGNVPPASKPGPNTQSVLFNAMVSPWTNFSIKAAMWYQGEANADQSCHENGTTHDLPIDYYAVAYAAMLKDWRDSKEAGDFPIATVQLPPSVGTGAEPNPLFAGRPDIRVAQAISGAHPRGSTEDVSGVAVTIDLGGSSNWGFDHPPNKNEISRRLALQLLHTAYGLEEDSIPLWTGPVLASARQVFEDQTVVLTFTERSSKGGLALRDVTAPSSVTDGRHGVPVYSNNCTTCCDGGGAPFEVTFNVEPSTNIGANTTWIRLEKDRIATGANTVTLSIARLAASGTRVTAVRYAWTDYVDCVLDNGGSMKIPAGPFRYFFNGDTQYVI